MATSTSAARGPVRPGAAGSSGAPAQTEYIELGLAQVPLAALAGIPLYLKTPGTSNYKLLCNETVTLTSELRTRIVERGVNAIYIPESSYAKFRQQVEPGLLALSKEGGIGVSARAELIYTVAVEFVCELIREGQLPTKLARLESISRALTSFVLGENTAFLQPVPASRHELYTASQSVVVALYLVKLAAAMGQTDPDKLNVMCQAGLLHDIGAANIPLKVLNKTGMLSAPEWDAIRSHPNAGVELLKKCPTLDPLIRTIAQQHHERMDGSGYPQKLKGDAIDSMGRMCAVIDSYVALMSVRPYRKTTMTVEQAMKTIGGETPAKYDATFVQAWSEVLVESKQLEASATVMERKRGATRFRIDCPVKLSQLEKKGDKWAEKPGFTVKGINISKSGIGVSSPTAIAVSEWVRIVLSGTGTLNRTVEGFVARCQAGEDGSFELGIQFGELPGQAAEPAAAEPAAAAPAPAAPPAAAAPAAPAAPVPQGKAA